LADADKALSDRPSPLSDAQAEASALHWLGFYKRLQAEVGLRFDRIGFDPFETVNRVLSVQADMSALHDIWDRVEHYLGQPRFYTENLDPEVLEARTAHGISVLFNGFRDKTRAQIDANMDVHLLCLESELRRLGYDSGPVAEIGRRAWADWDLIR
jgi:hypothetical protein